ncbi:MAG: GNAT family protein [Pseudomonadota bacterium]
MELTAPGLENAMLRLEPIAEQHRSLIFASEIEKSVWKWMPALPGGTNLENYFDFILKAQKSGLAATYVLFQKPDETFVGVTGFSEINKIHRRIRNALTWHPPHLTTSRLYQAGQLAMIQRAYDWRAKRIEWQVNAKNTYILDQLKVLNPTREALFRNYERTAEGVWVDKIIFAMTRPEMAGAIQRLTTELF